MIMLVAFLARVWSLELKPTHFDEGINGHFVIQLWKQGFYRYDPSNFHGPLYFYILQIAELFFGRGIFGYRFINGLLSVGIVGLIGMHRRFFGAGAIWAAAAVAISPAFVFYSRYAIHESLFILIQVAFSWGFFQWQDNRSRSSVAWMVMSFFAAIATKETFIIFFGTWLLAVMIVQLLNTVGVFSSSSSNRNHQFHESFGPPTVAATAIDFVIYLGLGVFLLIFLFTGFFMNMKGLGDMFSAFAFWSKTGSGGSGHEKPIWYWLNLMRIYEWPCLIGLIISPLVFFFNGRLERIVSLVAIGTCFAYSIIPYKTPWLILNLLWPLALVLGIGVARVGRIAAMRGHAFLQFYLPPVVVGALIVSVVLMTRLNFYEFANPAEPYVYVQSTQQFKNTLDTISERRKSHPEDLNMKIRVLNQDSWPMPWSLSDYPNLVFGQPNTTDLSGVDVVLLDASQKAAVEGKLIGRYWVLPFKIREAYQDGFAYFAFEPFRGFVPSDSKSVEFNTPSVHDQGKGK
jgi:uncharacterized protein (TIGR03663 family)